MLIKNENRPTVSIHLTNGFGNNLFQYIYSRLLSECHDTNLNIELCKNYYATDSLRHVGINISKSKINRFPTIRVNKNDNIKKYFEKRYKGYNFILRGYFEDYTIYENHLDEIKKWFTKIPKTNNKDLVLHLRLGDRLFYRNSYEPGMKVDPINYINAMKNFVYEKLYIVTDMKVWDYVTEQQLLNMKFHVNVNEKARIEPKISVSYFNSFIEEFKSLNPIVRFNNKIHDDFNFIRSFDKILFQHGTLAWWAAAISDASKVGVYGPWRPSKKEKNKNLGKTNFPGWFQWK